jgi:hypothetical protein
VFDLFTSVLVEALHRRRNVLKAEAVRFEEDGLVPLKACRDLVDGKLRATQLYIEEGRNILRDGGFTSAEEILRFTEKASQLGRLVKLKSELMNPTLCHVLFRFCKSSRTLPGDPHD